MAGILSGEREERAQRKEQKNGEEEEKRATNLHSTFNSVGPPALY